MLELLSIPAITITVSKETNLYKTLDTRTSNLLHIVVIWFFNNLTKRKEAFERSAVCFNIFF